jgi:hypothetical protein
MLTGEVVALRARMDSDIAVLEAELYDDGNGAVANLALDRALADTPGYSMAQLLRDTIDAGAPLSVAVLPMTPEEVAASYDPQPDTGQGGQPGSGDGKTP